MALNKNNAMRNEILIFCLFVLIWLASVVFGIADVSCRCVGSCREILFYSVLCLCTSEYVYVER